MTVTAKQRISNWFFILLGLAPVLYLLCFVTFLYYTGNGFGKESTYDPQPNRKAVYSIWLDIIHELENAWIASFGVWILFLIFTALFFKNVRTKPLVIATSIVFVLAIYLCFFTEYGMHEGWIDDYGNAIRRLQP